MTGKMGYYNVDNYAKQKRQQDREVKVPPKANFLAAANHIRKLFENKKFMYGFMGGLEMLCLGYRREMPDLHIAYDDKDFYRIKAKLEVDERVRLPEGMNSFFPAKCLIRTGPAYKDDGCTQTADIEVDLVPPGCCGTPPNGSLASNLVLLSLKTEGTLKSFRGLNISYLVKTFVHYCRVQDLVWDPRKDLLFLCQHYGEEVKSIRDQLDQKAVYQKFLGTQFFSRLNIEDQLRCYQILLGTEPPPVMAVTPPPSSSGHKHSVSASHVTAKPYMPGHNSVPALKSQHSPALLSPALPRQLKDSRQSVPDYESHLSKMPAPSGYSTTHTSQLATAKRDSRLRYRPVSVPSTHEANPITPRASRPQMGQIMQSSQPLQFPTQKLPFAFPQSLPYQQQPSSSLAPIPMATQDRRYTPNLSCGISGPSPPVTFAQTPLTNNSATYPQHLHTLKSPVEMSATPVPLNPGQQHMKLQAGLGYHPLQQHPVNKTPITEIPMPPRVQNSQAQQSTKVELFEYPMPIAPSNKFHVVNPEAERPSSLPLLQGKEMLTQPSRVGPTRYSSRSDSQSPPIPCLSSIDAAASANAQAPVELDATTKLGQYIAELSGERSTPAPKQHAESHVQHHVQSMAQPELFTQTHPAAHVQHSPVSSPESEYPSQYQDSQIRPLNSRAYSAPLAPLPASLMVGGLASHQRSSPNIMSQPQTTNTVRANVPNTNAARYTHHYSTVTPPSSAPNSARASPQPSPASTYKAYQPPSIPLLSPLLPLSPPAIPLSPPAIPSSSPKSPRPTNFTALKDIDGASGYFKVHRRDASNESSRSQDSSLLAQEYQAEMPGYGEGYGSPGRSVS